MTTTLYRIFDGDTLLYVGIATDLPKRLEQHRKVVSWWPSQPVVTQELYEDRQAARTAELVAIQAEQPRYNRAGHPSPPTGESPAIYPLRLPEGLKVEIKLIAKRTGRTMNDIIEQAIRERIKGHERA